MQKRSHKLLAAALLQERHGFGSKRHDLAFLFGSFQPDCNPFSYLKGSLRSHAFRGHNFSNSQPYIESQILRLQNRKRWTMRQYYTLGKLTHYLADAFTYPHNETFSGPLIAHRHYESELRRYLADHLPYPINPHSISFQNLTATIRALHHQYLDTPAGIQTDVHYIFQTAKLLMSICPGSK